MSAENHFISSIGRCFKILKAATLICVLSTFHCIASTNSENPKANKIGEYIQIGASYSFYNKISGHFAKKNPDKGLLGQISLGMVDRFKEPIALEVEGIYYNKNYTLAPTHQPMPTSINYKIQAFAALINAKYLFHEYRSIQPYAGLGLGVGYVKSRTQANYPVPDDPSHIMLKKKYSPACQAFIGVSKNLNKSFAFNAELRLVSLGKFTDDNDSGRIYQGLFSLGLKYII